MGLAVYFIVTTAQRFVTLYRWMWPPLAVLLGFGGVYIAHLPWWQAFTAAGISTLANGLEALLLATADRAILDIPRPRNPPSRR